MTPRLTHEAMIGLHWGVLGSFKGVAMGVKTIRGGAEISKVVEQIVERFHPHKIILFGS